MKTYKFICEKCIEREDSPCILVIEATGLVEEPVHCPFKSISFDEKEALVEWQDVTDKKITQGN